MLGSYSYGPSIPAKNLDRAIDFYENKLGCKVIDRNDKFTSMQSGDNQFMIYETENAGTAQNTMGGWFVDDLDATVEDLRRQGITFEEYDMPGLKTENGIATSEGMRCAWFKDTEGNILCVNGS